MPHCGSQILNCDLPIRLDSYQGCSLACAYCIERHRYRRPIGVHPKETVRALESFIYFRSDGGHRTWDTNWCDWDIPLHWGGQSDPFQPCEKIHLRSLQFLKIFADSYYPVVLSTKSTMILEEPYLSLIKHCNLMLQVSLVSPRYAKWERLAPSFRDRLKLLWKIRPYVKRLIVRVQPYTLGVLGDVIRFIPIYAAAGVHGLTIEGMKWYKKSAAFPDLSEPYGGSMVYPLEDIDPHFMMIQDACHLHNLRFYCAENRMRTYGDHETCCGCDGLPGFRVNRANFNYHPIVYTDRMLERGSGMVFRTRARHDTKASRKFKRMSYKEGLESFFLDDREEGN